MSSTKNLKKHKNKLLFFLILGISALFRFYRLEDLFFFSLDEEVISFHVRRITTGQHFPAIGVNAADTGLYLGPFYFYAAAPFFLALKNDPLAGAIFASLTGVLATTTIYFLGKTLGGHRVGRVAAFIHAVSLPIVLFERKFFNPNPAILVSALILTLLIRILNRTAKLWEFSILGAVLGLIFHLNLSLTPYLVFAIMILLLIRSQLNRKKILLVALPFLFMLTPLLFFDLRHNFQLSKAAVSLVTSERKLEVVTEQYPRVLAPVMFLSKVLRPYITESNILTEFATCPQAVKTPPHLIGIIACIGIGYLAFKKWREPKVLFLLGAFNFALVGVLFYPGRLQEYYQMILVAPFLVLTGYLLTKLKLHPWLIALLTSTIFMVNGYYLITMQNTHNLGHKKVLAKNIEATTRNEPYALNHSGDRCYGYGFLYLLQQQNTMPTASFIDGVIGWLYDNPPSNIPTNKVLTIEATKDQLQVTDSETKALE